MALPFVRLSPRDGRPGLGVAINERHAPTRVVEYLLELGHRRIGLVMGDPGHGASMARYQGYCAGLQRAGLAIDRKSGVAGKRGSVRVELGGRRAINKKKIRKEQKMKR